MSSYKNNLSLKNQLHQLSQKVVNLERQVTQKDHRIDCLNEELEFLRQNTDTKILEQWSNIQELKKLSLLKLNKDKVGKDIKNKHSNKVMNILELPQEILLHIFGYLSSHDILRRVAAVCKNFKLLTQDQLLIKDIYIKGNEYPDGSLNGIHKVLQMSKNLTKLVISCTHCFIPLKFALQNCPNLNHLTLDRISVYSEFSANIYNRIDTLSDNLMEDLVKYGQGITYLSIMPQDFESQWFGLSQVAQLKNLKTLLVNGCKHSEISHLRKPEAWTNFSATDLQSIANNCKYLEHLDLGEIGYAGSTEAFIELLKKRRNTLKSIALSITNDQFELCNRWYQILALCTGLEELSLHFFHDEMSYTSIEAISRLANLQVLKFNVRKISINKSIELFSDGKLKNLKDLQLKYGNGINKRLLITISKECPNLQYLDINDEKNILVTVLHNFRNLKKLRVKISNAQTCGSNNDDFFKKIAKNCKQLETAEFEFYCYHAQHHNISDNIKVLAISKLSTLKLKKLKIMEAVGTFCKEDIVGLFANTKWNHLNNLEIVMLNPKNMHEIIKGISINCLNLEKLSSTDLSEANILHLLKTCKSLKELYLLPKDLSIKCKKYSLPFLLEIRKHIQNLYISPLEGPISPLTSTERVEKLYNSKHDYDDSLDCPCERKNIFS